MDGFEARRDSKTEGGRRESICPIVALPAHAMKARPGEMPGGGKWMNIITTPTVRRSWTKFAGATDAAAENVRSLESTFKERKKLIEDWGI